jgi:hypothetical protein
MYASTTNHATQGFIWEGIDRHNFFRTFWVNVTVRPILDTTFPFCNIISTWCGGRLHRSRRVLGRVLGRKAPNLRIHQIFIQFFVTADVNNDHMAITRWDSPGEIYLHAVIHAQPRYANKNSVGQALLTSVVGTLPVVAIQ